MPRLTSDMYDRSHTGVSAVRTSADVAAVITASAAVNDATALAAKVAASSMWSHATSALASASDVASASESKADSAEIGGRQIDVRPAPEVLAYIVSASGAPDGSSTAETQAADEAGGDGVRVTVGQAAVVVARDAAPSVTQDEDELLACGTAGSIAASSM